MNLIPSDYTAKDHSRLLQTRIKQIIRESGGCISFARFMDLCLYAPGLGYYSAGAHKLGVGGDFTTAPEVSPLFAQCLANQCNQILTELNGGDILEVGAGSGVLAAELLLALEKFNNLPNHYYILEISADLIDRQKVYLSNHVPHLYSKVVWLSALPSIPITGIIFANEVVDAMPVHSFYVDKNNVKERRVTMNQNEFSWQLTDISDPQLLKRALYLLNEYRLPDGYVSEVSQIISAWLKTIGNTLKRGIVLLFDYGYGEAEYYHPDRYMGTLMCFYQHQKQDNPFLRVGLQDITAHVNFTEVVETLIHEGFSLAGYTTQAGFLLSAGLLELAEGTELDSIDKAKQSQAIKILTLPSEMGEVIKVMALSKHLSINLSGFSLIDRRRDL